MRNLTLHHRQLTQSKTPIRRRSSSQMWTKRRTAVLQVQGSTEHDAPLHAIQRSCHLLLHIFLTHLLCSVYHLVHELHEPTCTPDQRPFIDHSVLCDILEGSSASPGLKRHHQIGCETLDVCFLVQLQSTFLQSSKACQVPTRVPNSCNRTV